MGSEYTRLGEQSIPLLETPAFSTDSFTNSVTSAFVSIFFPAKKLPEERETRSRPAEPSVQQTPAGTVAPSRLAKACLFS